MPNGNEAEPDAVTIPAATVTTPSTASSQRRRTTIETQASSGMSSRAES
jgi:hypothetical protein